MAFMIILSCFTVEASSSLLNHVASNDKLQILGVVGSHIHDTVAKIANLRSNLVSFSVVNSRAHQHHFLHSLDVSVKGRI